ncbi:competence protein [Marivivens niveibacter]|uniref:Competence protein n=2 Tax=Marivivens niveibacter TaxID=1930667 RepID=A0A251WX05_9RHOB|nr:competence protein [Marivivens niveibacter]
MLLSQHWAAQRGHLSVWVPVCIGAGVVWYFALGAEPSVRALGGGVAVFVFCGVIGLRYRTIRPLFWAIALVLLGVGLATIRANAVAAPQLNFRYYGPIEGSILHLDRSQSGATRMTLSDVRLKWMEPDRTPRLVRVSAHGDIYPTVPQIGMRVMMTGHLSPPSGPVEPGGYDFQRAAWFAGLGAVGYTRTPVLQAGAPAHVPIMPRLRQSIQRSVLEIMPAQTAGFAATILTGDRSVINAEVMALLRATNLAHLLAISGLHMGLLTGFVFTCLRVGAAFFPSMAMRYPVKKIAAVCAIGAGAAYLAMSGAAVATERAFIMVAVMFVAVILDRRAVTLRSVALAATCILVFEPEEVVGPGFQMSFAATTALVAAFSAIRGIGMEYPKWARAAFGVFFSSLIAGLATAPFGAAHFNQISHYGLIANLLAVPVMGMIVMPGAVIAACLAPIGLASFGLFIMDIGLRWILFVAQMVGSWDGAVGHVVSPEPYVLGLITIGGLILAARRGVGRFMGTPILVLAFYLWSQTDRPAILIADSGAVFGVMTVDGRSVTKERGDGFAVQSWLENDGDAAAQSEAFLRGGWSVDERIFTTQIADEKLLLASGKTALGRIQGCDGADILITNQSDDIERPCIVYDIGVLRNVGAVAITPDGAIITARDVTGARLWNGGAMPYFHQ